MPDPLDPSAVLSALPDLLPTSAKRLVSAQDGVTALCHAVMSLLGFRLIAVDDPASPASYPGNVLPEEWNKGGPAHYTLKYRHDQSSLEFVIKLTKLGSRLLINAIAEESDKMASVDIATDDFTSPSFFPHNVGDGSSSPLVHGFISSNRVVDLIFQYKTKIVQKLIPGLNKDGYSEDSGPSSDLNPPAAGGSQPRAPQLPTWYPPRQPHRVFPDNPLSIGRRDLDPIPMNPGGPFAPPSLFPHNSGDGMIVGPDHPIFGAGVNDGFRERGPWGGDGFLPPIGAPPGARFDPVGPGFSGITGLGGRRTRGPPGGSNLRDPDNDEFMPPGMSDMFS